MLYCFPPGTLFLLERPKWYSGGEERAGRDVGGGHRSPRSTLAPAHLPPPSAPQLQPHLPPGKQQEEQRRLRGWRREGGGKEPEPEPPEGDGVGGLRPMTGVGAGSQQRGMAESISKTPGIKDTKEPRILGSWCPHPQEGVSGGGGEVGLKVMGRRQAFLLFQLGTSSPRSHSVWRARTASHDPLPGLEGEVLEGTCAEWKQKKPGDSKGQGEGRRGPLHVHCRGRESEGKGEGEGEERRKAGRMGSGHSGDSQVRAGRGGGEVNAEEARTALSLEGWQLGGGKLRLCCQGIERG